MKKKPKPEISFNGLTRIFYRDNKPITDAEARAHWDAIDADWTAGAYEEMSRRAME